MSKPKKSKKQVQSQDDYCPQEDIVDSQIQDNKQATPYVNNEDQDATVNKKTIMINKSQTPKVKNRQVLSKSQIKEAILKHAPEMREDIDILDYEALHQVYYDIVQPNQNLEQEQSKIIKSQPEQAYQERKQSNYIQQHPQSRNPEIHRMLKQIVKSVPHMKNQVQSFDDNQIRQLYDSILPAQQQHMRKICQKQQQNQQINQNQGSKIKDIRKLLGDKIPQMADQLKYLSNEDLLQVYEQYVLKEKPHQENRTKNSNGLGMREPVNGFQSHNLSSRASSKDAQHGPGMARFDPLKKFQSSNLDKKIKIQSNQQQSGSQPSWFNNYKYGQGKGKGQNDSRMPPPRNSQANNGHANSSYSQNVNPYQVYNFHNNQRVNSLPQPVQSYTRTVVIFHTMDPGYVPQLNKFRCKCPCCIQRQHQIYQPNSLNALVQQMMEKYSLKK